MSDRPPWDRPFRRFRRRFTARGRLVNRQYDVLRQMLDACRAAYWFALRRDSFLSGRTRLHALFVEWDRTESRRIRRELFEDLRPLHPGASDEELAAIVASFRVLARHLPVDPPRNP